MWRAATAEDEHAITAMCLALNAEDPGPKPVVAEQVHRTLETLRSQPVRGCAVVLDVDGEVVGYALLISFWSNEVGGELCTVDELFVLPSHRGQGHASDLLERLARGQGPRSSGAVAIALEVTPANTRAWKLYERLGFKGGNRTMRRMVGA
jgi:ribosomal protein S18 acetylase RimI-like enzyme